MNIAFRRKMISLGRWGNNWRQIPAFTLAQGTDFDQAGLHNVADYSKFDITSN